MRMAPASAQTGGRAREPMGWTDFCKRYEGECATNPLETADVVFDPGARATIARINAEVNRSIKPKTDIEHWGVTERWDYPDSGYGDCEDYVLLKRRKLMAAGLPRQALLITVVTDPAGDGHAVLTVRTDQGDYILDNMNDDVKLWRETPYGFVKRQSQTDPNLWVSIGGPADGPVIVSR
jgi:predicted transglutaminase-like cysteine proteinase